ncbi:MAG: hypothetical protein ACK5Q5_19310 [Planctomycetaceae bacterium]
MTDDGDDSGITLTADGQQFLHELTTTKLDNPKSETKWSRWIRQAVSN